MSLEPKDPVDPNFDRTNGIRDIVTPTHTLLAAQYKQSFAYFTFRKRLPATLFAVAKTLADEKAELVAIFGATGVDVEHTALFILDLRAKVLTNGPLMPFPDNEEDTAEWNEFLGQVPQKERKYFNTCWLYAECYLYRKIWSIFQRSPLAGFDYFGKQKRTAAQVSLVAMKALVGGTRKNERNAETFQQLVKANLWGNRCDLSITSGDQVEPSGNAFEQVAELEPKLIVDKSLDMWQSLNGYDGQGTVEIICDNAGYELFTDFILAEYIIDKGLARKVRFNVKAIPWFISDVTATDFQWMMDFLKDQEDAQLKELGQKLQRYSQEGKIDLDPLEYFWTSPYEFYQMALAQPELYERLSQAQLVIFKGDLNYRKLLGDYNWKYTESFESCLRGFRPTNVVTLRTVKADLICGLPEGLAEQLFATNKDWMLTGEYGIIQFASK